MLIDVSICAASAHLKYPTCAKTASSNDVKSDSGEMTLP